MRQVQCGDLRFQAASATTAAHDAHQFLADTDSDVVGLAQILVHNNLNTTKRNVARTGQQLTSVSERMQFCARHKESPAQRGILSPWKSTPKATAVHDALGCLDQKTSIPFVDLFLFWIQSTFRLSHDVRPICTNAECPRLDSIRRFHHAALWRPEKCLVLIKLFVTRADNHETIAI